ncbi:MAG: hypothetical protein HZB68_02915 [Candidatus Aenigmarchaeota archaeon]|nr:hypothetical protein [Candidatus Aenigmarchaeota archaeon]
MAFDYLKEQHGKSSKGAAFREGLRYTEGKETYSVTGLFVNDDYLGYPQFEWKDSGTRESLALFKLKDGYHLMNSRKGTHDVVGKDAASALFKSEGFDKIKESMKAYAKLVKLMDDIDELF